MSRVIDLSRGNSWGNAIYPEWGGKGVVDGSLRVTGLLTPLPCVGDTVIDNNGSRWTVESVTPWRNPPDGFAAVLRAAT